MPNLIVVAGPQAVGKMTVAEKLKEKIDKPIMMGHSFGGKLALILGLGVVGGVWKTGTVVIPIN